MKQIKQTLIRKKIKQLAHTPKPYKELCMSDSLSNCTSKMVNHESPF